MDVLETIKDLGPFVLAGYGTIILLRERLHRTMKDETETKTDLKDFTKHFQTYINTLNISIEKQALVTTMFEKTISSIVGKLEHLDQRLSVLETKVAILESKGK